MLEYIMVLTVINTIFLALIILMEARDDRRNK
jgi:hypothetical protein